MEEIQLADDAGPSSSPSSNPNPNPRPVREPTPAWWEAKFNIPSEIQEVDDSGSSSSSSSNRNPNPSPITEPLPNWWEVMFKIRLRLLALSEIKTSFEFISTIANSETPINSFLQDSLPYNVLATSMMNPESGSGDDPLCRWFYETFESSEPDLRLIVLPFIPLIIGSYLSRIVSSPFEASTTHSSLSGFEAILLSIYTFEANSRAGEPLLITIPVLSQPSLYHTPVGVLSTSDTATYRKLSVGVLSGPLEPKTIMKSTDRDRIVGTVLDCYYKQIHKMPRLSKMDMLGLISSRVGYRCSCKREFDKGGDEDLDNLAEELRKLDIEDDGSSVMERIPLPWELLGPMLRIIAHCLLDSSNQEDMKDAASVAVRRLYARASHELVPQAILATRSLIHLDRSARLAAKAAAIAKADREAKKKKGKERLQGTRDSIT